MKLHNLPPTTSRPAKRLGRGYGSGRGGHTATRGQKGQKTRGKIPAHFIGTSWVWFKRLPFIRGKSLFSPVHGNYTLTLGDLAVFKSGETVSFTSLQKVGLLPPRASFRSPVKLVATGSLEKKLTIKIPASASAARAVTKAGGSYQWPA